MRFITKDSPVNKNVPAIINAINKQIELLQKGERDTTGQVELEMTKEFDKLREVASESIKKTIKLPHPKKQFKNIGNGEMSDGESNNMFGINN